MSTKPTFEIDLERHVYPLLHLARMAVVLEKILADIDQSRRILPDLDRTLKQLGCLTDYGISLADHADVTILAAIDLLEAHQQGPNYVVLPVSADGEGVAG